jgi:hypothetical protein
MVELDKNIWLDKAIHQLYMMREEHVLLMKEFYVLKQKVGEYDGKIFFLVNKIRELEDALKDQVVVL